MKDFQGKSVVGIRVDSEGVSRKPSTSSKRYVTIILSAASPSGISYFERSWPRRARFFPRAEPRRSAAEVPKRIARRPKAK